MPGLRTIREFQSMRACMTSDDRFDSDDTSINPSANPTLAEVVEERLENPARRGLFQGIALTAALGFIGSTALPRLVAAQGALQAAAPAGAKRPAALGFRPVAKGLADAVIVPEGYTARPLFRLGDPM